MDKEDYQFMADCIRSGQVPDAAVIEIMREDPLFEQWYRARYKLPVEQDGDQGPTGDVAEPS